MRKRARGPQRRAAAREDGGGGCCWNARQSQIQLYFMSSKVSYVGITVSVLPDVSYKIMKYSIDGR